MLFFVLLIYITVSFVYPGEVFPTLAPLRITYWTGLLGLGLSIAWLSLKRFGPLTTLQLWFLALFTVVLALSRIVNEHYLGAIIPTLISFGPSLTMFILAVTAVDSLRKLRIAAGLVSVLAVILVLQGAAAYHFGWNSRMFLFDPVTRGEYTPTVESLGIESPPDQLDASEATDEDGDQIAQMRIRGLGLLHDPNDLAVVLVFALPLLAFAWKRGSTFRNMLLVIAPGIAVMYGVFLTHSRGGALALLVTLCVGLGRRFGKVAGIVLFCLLTAGGLTADFAGGRKLLGGDESAKGRIEAWSEGLQMFKEQPLLGVGYEQFIDHYTLTAHNSFVLCFAETGIVGYSFWLGMILLTLVELRGLRAIPIRDPTDAHFARAATIFQLAIVGFLTAAFFLSRTFIPMLYLIVGMAVALILIARDAGKAIRLPNMTQFGGMLVFSEIGSIVMIYVAVKLRLI